MGRSEVVGRDGELEAIALFLEQRAGAGALLIEGEAGIGKTTLWRWGVEHASEHGWLVLAAGPAAAEARLGFAAIGDLLGGVVDVVAPRLPSPQRHALEVALLLQEGRGRPADERTVAVAVLGALRVLASERSVLVAVDDVQWLDRPSAEVLAFVARRLGDDPLALLLAYRSDGASGVPLGLERALGERLARVRPPPLSLGATHRLLRSHLGLTLSRPALRRVHGACGGKPLFALEIGRVLKERPDALGSDEPLPVPQDVEELVRQRVGRLSGTGREAVLAAALLGRPAALVLEQAAETTGLEEAVAAGVLVADGDAVRFAHPLFAEAAVSLTPEGRRREMHLRLAALLADAEAQAQHLALGTSEPGAEVAETLERASEVARSRGARAAAAALAEHAARLTPPGDVDLAARRVIAAAMWWTDAGDTQRSLALVEPLLPELPAGPLRLEALRAKVRAVEDRRVYRRVLEDALGEAEGYPRHQVNFLFGLCYALLHAQEFDAARERARVAVDLAERTGDPELKVMALSMHGRLDVGIAGVERLQRASKIERDLVDFDAYDSPATWLGWWLLANDELGAGRRLLLEQQRRALATGNDWNRMWLQWPLTEVECRSGNYDAARETAATGAELAEQSESLYALTVFPYCQALVAAHIGDAASARVCAEESLAKARALHSELFTIRPRIALAFLAVSERRHADAVAQLEGLPELALTGPYWAAYPFWGDLVEALVSLGELDRARSLLADLDAHRHAVVRPGTAPLLARCRGLVLASSGALDEGVASLEESLRLQQARPAPLERARTLLALGEVQRRAKQRRAARETLQEALTTFEQLGARLWAERARQELARIGGRRPSGTGELTPSEQRIAELVAAGKTNKEVAAILVVTDRTVESALTQIYRKLDVRSRTELARQLAAAG